MGGDDSRSNGIHLNHIEVAVNPADESWRNINGMSDLAHALITPTDRITIAMLQDNADTEAFFYRWLQIIVMRVSWSFRIRTIKKSKLYGSEYWTYLLRWRVGQNDAPSIQDNHLSFGALEAQRIELIDECFSGERANFKKKVAYVAETIGSNMIMLA